MRSTTKARDTEVKRIPERKIETQKSKTNNRNRAPTTSITKKYTRHNIIVWVRGIIFTQEKETTHIKKRKESKDRYLQAPIYGKEQ